MTIVRLMVVLMAGFWESTEFYAFFWEFYARLNPTFLGDV